MKRILIEYENATAVKTAPLPVCRPTEKEPEPSMTWI